MKITKVNIPSENDGLKNIKMEKLGSIVIITGKNGSGKTRILNKISSVFSSKPNVAHINSLEKDNVSLATNIENYTNVIINHQKTLLMPIDGQIYNNIINDITNLNENIDNWNIRIKNNELLINWNIIETSEEHNIYSIVNFVPKSLDLKDSSTFSKSVMVSSSNNIDGVGINNLPQGAFAKIQVIQDRWFEATHQNSQLPEHEKQSAIDSYDKLQNIIFIFLNTVIGRTIDGDATLFGFKMGQSNLSDGQKILLQFCLAIYSQEAALKDLILVLDEPENHLHPSVIIETIERIQKSVSNGQIWIATHSVPLLAHFDPSHIWYVEDGKIEHAGKIPEKVLGSLLGDENEIAKLQDFISLPAQYATSRYAFESLLEPHVVTTGSTDPQSIQIRTDLLQLNATGKLRILDYGAGKGRLISNITDLDESNKEKLIHSMEYIAFDKFPDDKDLCESALIKAYGTSTNKYFNDIDSLLSIYDKESFDIVIMCNVLHEIDPKEWIKLFKADGTISSLLSTNGILLLVEDHQIPIGEKAYQKGFLVLDTAQLKDLFKITEKDKGFIHFDSRGDGRLKAHHIPKNCLIRIDPESRIDAIRSMSKMASSKILAIREQAKSYKNGTLHGFWTQQFANAQLNLEELE